MNAPFRFAQAEQPRTAVNWKRIAAVTLCAAVAGLGAQSAMAQAVAGKDKTFLVNAAEAGNAEVAASKIALEKSQNADVKAFAQKMIDEHTKVGDKLKQIADAKNVKVPAEPSVAQRAKIAILEKLSGNTFDKRYASSVGVSAHEDAVKLFQKASSEAADPEIKSFAADTLPGLKEHLQMGKDLKAKVDADAKKK